MRLLQWIVLFATVALTSQAFAIDFKFKDINNQHRKLSDYKGQWTIVNYWGVRCGPCRAEVPELNKIHRKYRGKVQIIGIELMSSTNRTIRSFMANNGMRFTVAGTQRSVINPLGVIRSLPTSFIISPDGRLVKKHTGILTERTIRPYIKQAQKVKKPQQQANKQNAPVQNNQAQPTQQQAVAVQAAQKPQAQVQLAEKPKPAPKKAPAKKKNHGGGDDFLMSINPDDFF